MRKEEEKCYLCGNSSSVVQVVSLVCEHDLCLPCVGDRLTIIRDNEVAEAICSLCSESTQLDFEVLKAIDKHNTQNSRVISVSSNGSNSSSRNRNLQFLNMQSSPKASGFNGTANSGGICAPSPFYSSVFPIKDKQNIINAIGSKLLNQNAPKGGASNTQASTSLAENQLGPSNSPSRGSKSKSQEFNEERNTNKVKCPEGIAAKSNIEQKAPNEHEANKQPGQPLEMKSTYEDSSGRSTTSHQRGNKKKIVSFASKDQKPIGEVISNRPEESSGMVQSIDVVRNSGTGTNSSQSNSENSTNRAHLNSGNFEDSPSQTQRKSENSLAGLVGQYDSSTIPAPNTYLPNSRKATSLGGVVEAAVRDIRIVVHNLKQIEHCIEECKMLIEQLDANWEMVRDKKQYNQIKSDLELFFMKYRGISLLSSQDELRRLMMPLQMEARILSMEPFEGKLMMGGAPSDPMSWGWKPSNQGNQMWNSMQYNPMSPGNHYFANYINTAEKPQKAGKALTQQFDPSQTSPEAWGPGGSVRLVSNSGPASQSDKRLMMNRERENEKSTSSNPSSKSKRPRTSVQPNSEQKDDGESPGSSEMEEWRQTKTTDEVSMNGGVKRRNQRHQEIKPIDPQGKPPKGLAAVLGGSKPPKQANFPVTLPKFPV